jgi:hypothetical protein
MRGRSGMEPCPHCGARTYPSDSVCLTCGADREPHRSIPAPPDPVAGPIPPASAPLPAPILLPSALKGWTMTSQPGKILLMIPSPGWRMRQRWDRVLAGVALLAFGGYGWSLGVDLYSLGAMLVGGGILARFFSREAWRVGPDSLRVRRSFLGYTSEQLYQNARLELRATWAYYRHVEQVYYELRARTREGTDALLASAVLQPVGLLALGRFLSQQTGWEFTERRRSG